MKAVVFSVLFVLSASNALAQSFSKDKIQLTSSTQASPSYNLRGLAITLHSISWNSYGTVSAGACALLGSVDGTTFGSTIITAQTVTSSGGATALAVGNYNWVKISCTTPITGTGTVEFSYNGYKSNPVTDANGNPINPVTDPCDGVLSTTVAISQTASTKLVSATSGKKTYICTGAIVAGAAEILNIVEGTGSVCDSGTAPLVGSATAGNGMSFSANGGFTINKTISGITANVDVCLTQNGSNRLAGFITYVQQ